jgi:hypothetical protein
LSTEKYRVVSYLDRDNQEWFEVQRLNYSTDPREPNYTYWSFVSRQKAQGPAVLLKRKLELPEQREFKVIE